MQLNVLEAGIKKHLGTFGDFGVISLMEIKLLHQVRRAVLLKNFSIIKKVKFNKKYENQTSFEQKFADIGYNYSSEY